MRKPQKVTMSLQMDTKLVEGLERRAALLSAQRRKSLRWCDVIREAAQALVEIPEWEFGVRG